MEVYSIAIEYKNGLKFNSDVVIDHYYTDRHLIINTPNAKYHSTTYKIDPTDIVMFLHGYNHRNVIVTSSD